MKKIFALVFVMLLLVASAAMAQSDELIAAAKAEGEQDIVRVQQLAGENGNRVGAPIEIPILDNSPMPRIPNPASKDYFFTPVGGTGMGGMMGGGMGMMP